MNDRRGSLSIDDEGVPGQYNVLVENGVLKGYMQDKHNAKLMGVAPTGNGRRESYAHLPMPRMTNTYMLGGDSTLNRSLPVLSEAYMRRTLAAGRSISPRGNLYSPRQKLI